MSCSKIRMVNQEAAIMKASVAVTEILEDWNINHVYGYPGDSVNNLIESLRKSENNIDFIQVRHEEVAALSASAEAKFTDNVSVCVSIGGPGAIHLLNGMYDAKKDSAPMVVITGQISHDLLGTDNFQEVTLERMFDDVAILNRRVTSGKQLQPLLKQAFKEAYDQKGVAVLSVPDDVFLDSVNQKSLRSTIVPEFNIFPTRDNMDQAISHLEQAKKPVILAGKGALDAREELVAFADKIAAPVVVSLRGKGVLPDEHRLNLGNLGQIGTKPAYEAMEETDLLILAGTCFPYREFLPDNASAIQIDISPDKLGKWYPVNVGLAGTVKEVSQHLTEQVADQNNRNYLKACQENMDNRSEEHTSELQSRFDLVCRLLLEKKKTNTATPSRILGLSIGSESGSRRLMDRYRLQKQRPYSSNTKQLFNCS